MANSDVLNFTEEIIVDEEIERFEFHEYEPVSTNINTPVEIKMNIEQQDLFTLPSEAYLLVEGRLLKADETSYADRRCYSCKQRHHALVQADFLSIVESRSGNHLQPRASYHHDWIPQISREFQLSEGMNQLWQRDVTVLADLTNNNGFKNRQNYIITQSEEKGTFSFCIPLKHIFGFCDDYDKVLYGFKHTLTLVRKSDSDAIFRTAATAAGRVDFGKLSLFMPHVTPSVEASTNLYKVIESKWMCHFHSDPGSATPSLCLYRIPLVGG